MKKISLILIAVLCMAFVACNNNTGSGNPETVTPNEILKNLPVTAADFAEMLGTDNRSLSRAAEPVLVNLAEQDSISINESKISTTSEILLLIMKFCISQTEDFEFGKNTRIGVIGDAFENAKDEFLTVYPAAEVDSYLANFATRDFGTVRVDLDDSRVVIFWHLASWSDSGKTFPDCYLYITGTYKNGKYENLAVYGEGYCYRYTENWTFEKAVPVFEKTYVSDNKVIVAGQSLDDLDTIGNNNLYRIDYPSDSYSGYSTSLDHNVTVVYKDASYIMQGRLEGSNYECYVINPDSTLVLEQDKVGNEYKSFIPLKYLSLPEGAALYKDGSNYTLKNDNATEAVPIIDYNYNENTDPVYKNTSTTSTEYVKTPFSFTKAEDCTTLISKFIELRKKGLEAGTYAAEILSKTELEGYQKKLADWKQTVSE